MTVSVPATASAADDVTTALSALNGQSVSTVGPATIGDQYAQEVAAIGVLSSTAQGQSANQDVLLTQLDRQRQQVSGVSIDEEATHLIQYQHAYQAAARVISVMDSMLDTLNNGRAPLNGGFWRPMRVTPGMMMSSMLHNIQLNQARTEKLQNQITSGSQITKPSDDPIGAARALNLQESLDHSEQYVRNIDQATSWLNTADSALDAVTQALQRGARLAVQGASDTLSGPIGRPFSLRSTSSSSTSSTWPIASTGRTTCLRARVRVRRAMSRAAFDRRGRLPGQRPAGHAHRRPGHQYERLHRRSGHVRPAVQRARKSQDGAGRQ